MEFYFEISVSSLCPFYIFPSLVTHFFVVSSFPLNKSHAPVLPLGQSQRCWGMSPWPFGYTVRGGSQPRFVAQVCLVPFSPHRQWATLSFSYKGLRTPPFSQTNVTLLILTNNSVILVKRWCYIILIKLHFFGTEMVGLPGWMCITCQVCVGGCYCWRQTKLIQVLTQIFVFMCLTTKSFEECVFCKLIRVAQKCF